MSEAPRPEELPPEAFEGWVADELRRAPAGDPAAALRAARVMARVRALPRPGRRGVRWPRRAPSLAVAAMTAGVVALHALAVAAAPRRPAAPAGLAAAGTAVAVGDTIVGQLESTLRDTLRLVRYALVAPGASRVALVGRFNRWDPRATPLLAAGGGWTVTVAVAPGERDVAFVVDDSQWVAAPALH